MGFEIERNPLAGFDFGLDLRKEMMRIPLTSEDRLAVAVETLVSEVQELRKEVAMLRAAGPILPWQPHPYAPWHTEPDGTVILRTALLLAR